MEDFLKEFKAEFEVDNENQVIRLTYDCGSEEDAEHFENKVTDAAKSYGINICTVQLESTFDEVDEEILDDEDEENYDNNEEDLWIIVEVEISCENFDSIDKENLKEFIMFVDTI